MLGWALVIVRGTLSRPAGAGWNCHLGGKTHTLNFRNIKRTAQLDYVPAAGVARSFMAGSRRTPREPLFCFIGCSHSAGLGRNCSVWLSGTFGERTEGNI